MSRKAPKFADESPLGKAPDDLAAVDRMIYGGNPGLPDSGRVIAKPTPIYSLRPDRRQPRRLLPDAVRGDWDGDPVGVPDLLGRWLEMVEARLNGEIPMLAALSGTWERKISDAQLEDPLIAEFMATISLAASIKRDGLRQAVEFAHGVLIFGERRWWAYHMLNLWCEEDYSKIPAVEKPKPDVWAQAAENGARAPLNAVGMARQLALLIMDMYEGDPGVHFTGFDDMVLPGECDRKFYAQVGRGDLYPIKRGMGERVLSVTGLANMDRVRRYRALLNIPDGLWTKADDQSWTEWQIREYVDAMKPTNADVTPERGVSDGTPAGTGNAKGNLTPDHKNNLTPDPSPKGEGRQTGLYGGQDAAPPAQKQPHPQPLSQGRGETRPTIPARYEEDYDDFEEPDEVEDVLPSESTVAILATWHTPLVAQSLTFFKQVSRGDEQMRLRIIELLTLSNHDLLVKQERTAEGFWDGYMNAATEALVSVLQGEIVTALEEYLAHLRQAGRDIREKHERGGW